jgi:hypothetical protein
MDWLLYIKEEIIAGRCETLLILTVAACTLVGVSLEKVDYVSMVNS